jgi:hypothetical protein
VTLYQFLQVRCVIDPDGDPPGGYPPAQYGWQAAAALFISQKVVEKHVANIFDKLGLAPDDNDNRRVIAALRYLES